MTQITTLDIWEMYHEYIMECGQYFEHPVDWINWLFENKADLPQDLFLQLVAEEV